MQFPKMVYLKAQDTSEGVKVWRIVQDSSEESQAIQDGYVTDWRECGIEEVRKRGRPPKAQEPEPIPDSSGGLF